MIKNKRKILRFWPGQSLVEYLVLFAAVIVFLLLIIGKNGIFGKVYKNEVVERQANYMFNMSQKIFN